MSPPGRSKVTVSFDEARGGDITIRPPCSAKAKRTPPFSMRFTHEERMSLKKAAGNQSLSAFIKSRLFEAAAPVSVEARAFKTDQKALAAVLGALGQSRLSQNLSQIAKSCHLGILPLTPELVEDIETACSDVREIRGALIDALKQLRRQP